MSQREKTLLLLGVILIICSLVISEWLNPPQPTSPSLHAGQSRNKPPFSQSGLTLNIPESKRTVTLKNPRNIFAPLKNPHMPKTVKAPPPQHVHPPSLQPSRPLPSTQPLGPSSAELAVRQAEQEMQQYKFLGYLTKEGVQQGFLSKGQEIYIVKQGEVFENDLEIKSIGSTEIVLSKHVKQAGSTVEITLPLTEDGQDAF